MNITIFDTKPLDEEILSKALAKHTLSFVKEPLTEKTAAQAKDAEVVSVFVSSDVTKKSIEAMPSCKLIATRSTGFDHIDTEACKEKDITVCNVPTYGENTVAEHAFALLLDISRKISASTERTKKNDFTREGLEGFDLEGKTLGIVGTGNIGKHAVRMGSGFNMNLVGFDIVKNEELIKKYGLKYASYEDVLKKADVLTFHVPLNKHTEHMFNQSHLPLLKEGVVMINTSRGPVLETEALLKGITSGKIGFLGTDVLEDESIIGGKGKVKGACGDLLAHEHVLMTPHNAFNTREAKLRILETTVKNITKKANVLNL